MERVFSTEKFDLTKRFAKWQEAICEHYLNVDVSSQKPEEYYGFIDKFDLGPAAISDVFLSNQQDIVRGKHHIARLDKECFYVMFPSKGSLLVEQSGEQLISTPGTAVLFDSVKRYRLRCQGDSCQSMYIEIPRSILIDKCPVDKITKPLSLDFSDGLGWAFLVFCKLIASGSESYSADAEIKVATEIADLLALFIDIEGERKPAYKNLSAKFRLQLIKSFIENHLYDPELSPMFIAKNHGISLRYLHYLFKSNGLSVSEWIREKRLEKSFQKLTSKKFKDESITDISFSLGFNSSSHFSRLFKQKFGITPRNTRKIIGE